MPQGVFSTHTVRKVAGVNGWLLGHPLRADAKIKHRVLPLVDP